MDKKYLIASLVAIAVLIGAIVWGFSSLYSSGEKSHAHGDERVAVERYNLLPAVPSDAAMVLYFKNLDRALALLTDTTSAFSALVADARKGSFDRFIKEASAEQYGGVGAAISVHYSGDLIPLLICGTGHAQGDTSAKARNLMDYAALAGLHTRLLPAKEGNLLLISASETLIHSSVRHLDNGTSILEDPGFSTLAASVSSHDIIFVSNNYTLKLMGAHMDKRFYRYAGFFKRLSSWTAFRIDECTEKHTGMDILPIVSESSACWLNVARNYGDAESHVADILPAHTVFVLSQPIGNLDGYLTAYKAYLDACGMLDKWQKQPENWAKAAQIREVARVDIPVGSKLESVIVLRTRTKTNEEETIRQNDCPGYVPAVFGSLFALEDESCTASVKDWILIGSRRGLETLLDEGFAQINLRSFLSDASLGDRFPVKGNRLLAYWSASENPALIPSVFRGPAATAWKRKLHGVGYVPVFLRINSNLDICYDADRTTVTRSQVPTVERDTVVTVPTGPFKVQNSGTGATNLFYQAPNMFLCLKEEGGKGIWGVPFKTPICGRVHSIDWYANGKLQFLFGSGSSLWLIDRLGRFVKGFPVDLGKEILLGPDAYDFSGAHGYTAMILHKDNTIAMYNLHAKKPQQWQDIAPSETIKNLPELLEVNGKRYWVVRTSLQTLIYPFWGGEALKTGEKNKKIRPDSPLEPTSNGAVRVMCYDGRERTIKL